MEIGKGWTKTKEQTKETYISCVFDDTFLELCPNLKNCGLILRHIAPSDRKSEKSPHWTVRLFAKQEQTKADTTNAEETIKAEAIADTENQVDVIEFSEEEIPF